MIAHACAAHLSFEEVFSLKSAWSLFLSSQSSTCQRQPPRLTVTATTPPRRGGQGQSSGKATAGGQSPGVRVSLLSPDNYWRAEQKPRSGAGLEAGTLAGGVVGAHHLGLGHHAVLLLREGVAICRERETRGVNVWFGEL